MTGERRNRNAARAHERISSQSCLTVPMLEGLGRAGSGKRGRTCPAGCRGVPRSPVVDRRPRGGTPHRETLAVTVSRFDGTFRAAPRSRPVPGLCWSKSMKIAQIAPLMESVPPRLYGGTERIVSYLTEELVRLGHEVTLFASGDSVTSANLVGCAPMALRLDANVRDPIPYYMLMLDRVRQHADDFDILHFHIDQFHFPLFRPHGRSDRDDAARPAGPARPQAALCRLQRHAAGVDLQRATAADRRTPISSRTIYHGIPADLLKPTYQSARRLCRVSRPHLAGEAARPRHRRSRARSASR